MKQIRMTAIYIYLVANTGSWTQLATAGYLAGPSLPAPGYDIFCLNPLYKSIEDPQMSTINNDLYILMACAANT